MERKQSKFGKMIIVSSRVVLALVVVFLLMNGLTDYEESRFLFSTQSKWVLAMLVICAVIILQGFLICSWRCFQKMSDRGNRILRSALVLMAFVLQGIFLFYYRSFYLFDTAYITGAASALAQTGTVAEEAVLYLSVYPNQNAYTVLTAVLWKIGMLCGMSRGQIPLLLNFFNLLSLDGAVALFFMIVKECKPSLTSAKWTFLYLLMFLNPFLYIGVSYYYTITLSMPFFMLLLYWYVKYLKKEEYQGVKIPILAGVVLGLGYLMRATTVIPAIAIGCALLFLGKKRKKDLLILVMAILCIASVGKINSAYIGLDTKDTAFPASHWIMMSMTSPGCHNGEDVDYTLSFSTAEEKKAAVAARIREKAETMSAKDWISLVLAKMKNTWGNGSNGYTVYLEHCLRTDGLFKWVFGNRNDFMILYHQAYFMLLLLWILYDIITSMLSKRVDSYVFQLTFLGGILFYVLWETSAQYSLPFLFVLMILAVFGMEEKLSRQKEQGIKFKKAENYVLFSLQVITLIFFGIFLVKKCPVFTQMAVDENNPVVTQILANEELELKDGETLEQTFVAAQPFNQIVFQWRNPDTESNAEYQVEVKNAQGELICEEIIKTKGQPYSGASVLAFPSVIPKKQEEYAVSITKISGDAGENLRFVTYKMGYYDAYPYGEFRINQKEQTRDMLLAVSEIKTTPYCSRGLYVLIGSIFMLSGAAMCWMIKISH